MENLLEILEHPLLITIISVIIGTGILGQMAYRRSRRDVIRDKSLSFLEETASSFNQPMARIFYVIRNCKASVPEDIRKKSGDLFVKRLHVRVISRSFLKNKKFYKSYDGITWEIRNLLNKIEVLESHPEADISIDISKRLSELENLWDMKVKPSKEGLPEPYHSLMNWANMIWRRIDIVLSTEISKVLKRGLWR